MCICCAAWLFVLSANAALALTSLCYLADDGPGECFRRANWGGMRAIRGLLLIITAILVTGIGGVAPAGASGSFTLDGSFSTVIARPDFVSLCPSGVAR
jgi:hypothetical protein